jgi:acetyltransferase-like isoleucine patch superfamily enzyme
MKKRLLRILIFFVKLVKPFIRFIAHHSDIPLFYAWQARGIHPLIFLDTTGSYKEHTPKSVYFNTMSGKIIVGKNTVFSEDVLVLTGKHKFISEIENINDLHDVPKQGRDIIIGNNCYIGGGAIIIGPVVIGDYSVICAGAVVTKNVPEKTMVGGVPAKKIKDL